MSAVKLEVVYESIVEKLGKHAHLLEQIERILGNSSCPMSYDVNMCG